MADIKERRLDAVTLSDHAIRLIDYHFPTFFKLPPHIESIRKGLLDGRNIFNPKDKVYFTEEEWKTIPTEYIGIPEPGYRLGDASRQGTLQTFIGQCRLIANKAQNVKNFLFTSWQSFMTQEFFDAKEIDALRASFTSLNRNYSHFDRFGRTSDQPWDAAQTARNLNQKALCDPPIPKPSLFFGFPVAVDSASIPTAFADTMQVQNFTQDILRPLTRHGLVSVPTQRIELTKDNEDLKGAARICFPWSVVEYPKVIAAGDHLRHFYYRAANSASASLSMFERLARYAEDQQKNCHIPPVIAFTGNGPVVRAWMAYSSPGPNEMSRTNDHTIVCVWEGSVDNIWGVIQLQIIIEHMYFWAARILRPQISFYIDQWCHRHIADRNMNIINDDLQVFNDSVYISRLLGRVDRRADKLNLPKMGPRSWDELSRLVILLHEVFDLDDKQQEILGSDQKSAPNGTHHSSKGNSQERASPIRAKDDRDPQEMERGSREQSIPRRTEKEITQAKMAVLSHPSSYFKFNLPFQSRGTYPETSTGLFGFSKSTVSGHDRASSLSSGPRSEVFSGTSSSFGATSSTVEFCSTQSVHLTKPHPEKPATAKTESEDSPIEQELSDGETAETTTGE